MFIVVCLHFPAGDKGVGQREFLHSGSCFHYWLLHFCCNKICFVLGTDSRLPQLWTGAERKK